jgi:hypothetical protein
MHNFKYLFLLSSFFFSTLIQADVFLEANGDKKITIDSTYEGEKGDGWQAREWRDLHIMGPVHVQEQEWLFYGREARYEVAAENMSEDTWCMISRLLDSENTTENWVNSGRVLIEGGQRVSLGGFEAAIPGKSWHFQWEYRATRDLSMCE